MDFRKIHDGIADHDKHFALLNRHSGPPWVRPDSTWAGEWWEMEESDYWCFLEVLPPLHYVRNGFAMSEFTSGNVTSVFYKIGDRFFHCSVDWSKPGAFDAARNHIRGAIQ